MRRKARTKQVRFSFQMDEDLRIKLEKHTPRYGHKCTSVFVRSIIEKFMKDEELK